MRRFLFPALTTCVAAALLVSFAIAADDKKAGKAGKGAQVGQPAPEFTLKDQNGKEVSLSDYKGKIVVLEWFNDVCPYVVKFYPESKGKMNEFARAAQEKDVVWLAINSTRSSTSEHNAKVAKDWHIDRPLLDDATTEVAKQYGATNTPHMYVIDTEGKIAYKGAIDDKPTPEVSSLEGATNYVMKAIEELQSGSKVSTPETKAYGCGVKYAK